MPVYFIENTVTHDIKVGHSNDPDHRLESGQTWSPDPLVILGSIPGGYREERALHGVMGGYFDRKQGEWFEGSETLTRYVQTVIRLHGGLFGQFVENGNLEPEICYLASAAVSFPVSVYWMALPDDEGEYTLASLNDTERRCYQVMRHSEGPGKGHEFWGWYLWEMPQFYSRPIDAAVMFVHAWHDWVRRGGDPN